MNAQAAARDLIEELSDLAIRILDTGGAGALGASAVALVEGAAAAMPVSALPYFSEMLLQAVASGARMSGHKVTLEIVEPDERRVPGRAVH